MGLRTWIYKKTGVNLKKANTSSNNILSLYKELKKKNGNKIASKFLRLAIKKRLFCRRIPKKPKSILFLMPTKGIGDGIIFTGLFKMLNGLGFNLYVIASAQSAFLYENDPHFKGASIYSPNLTREDALNQMGVTSFDLCIDMYGDRTPLIQRVVSLSAISTKWIIGFNGDAYHKSFYDHSINYNELDKHLSYRSVYLLRYLNIAGDIPSYYLPIPEPEEAQGISIITRYREENKLIVALSPFASSEHRSFSLQQTKEIIERLTKGGKFAVILVGKSSDLKKLKLITNNSIYINKSDSFFESAAIIKHADIVLSTETSAIHVSNVYDKPLISTYCSAPMEQFNNDINFAPNYDRAIQIIAPNKNIKKISTDTILSYVELLLEEPNPMSAPEP